MPEGGAEGERERENERKEEGEGGKEGRRTFLMTRKTPEAPLKNTPHVPSTTTTLLSSFPPSFLSFFPPSLPPSFLLPEEPQMPRPEISDKTLEVGGEIDPIHVLLGVVRCHARGKVDLGVVHDFQDFVPARTGGRKGGKEEGRMRDALVASGGF